MIRRTALGALGAAILIVTPGAGAADAQPLSLDPFTNPSGQHETGVEPDSLSLGDTVVATFQLGRMVDGGASGNGWATSPDGGTTWRHGVLPGLTIHQSPPGPYSRVTDPTIAYDRAHAVWLAAGLALRETPADLVSSIVVSRSSDGLVWGGPIVAAAETGRFAHDKPWVVCDTGASSPRFGRCYLTWTARPGQNGVLALATSDDGGATWSAPTVVESARGSGWQPLVRPDGTLVVVYEGARTIEAVRSTDGGRSFSPSVTVGALRPAPVPGVRAPALPSAEIDDAGAIWAAWQDCRFRTGCPARSTPNDLVLASSPDGVTWSRVRRIPTRPELDGLTHFVPGVAVDATTRGTTTRLAVAFYVLTPRGCSADACSVAPMLVSSADAGRTWSAPESLAAPQPLSSFPLSNAGRFLGDYISTSFVAGGAAVPVFATASGAPADGKFRQGVFAARVAPLASRGPLLRLGTPMVRPQRPSRGQRVTVTVDLSEATATGVSCSWRGRAVRLSRATARVAGRRATCIWRVQSARPGARVQGFIGVLTPEEEAQRAFAFRVRA